ncbi:amino acid adenylation domain-containing protein [Streptomyces sp. NBC_01764]|uniref:non-ribosomal peptide synthetase n=1 Tax=Streptomyces sp. NBC_01764 TaxID=2975935 RepID=UPI00224D910C|nr:amino acid adenylation domain-containing protein [Streptomyces sp. NBC_01764]MCX4404260.1 amino acid adenylation domain-containing protein [Streptomyces sp. NBC_01764]
MPRIATPRILPSAPSASSASGPAGVPSSDPAPLSLAQERLWVLARMGGEASAAYHGLMNFDLRGPLDANLLVQALHLLAARHEALRTRLVPAEGSALQVVDPPETGFPVTVEDLRGLPDAGERLAEAQRAVGGTPFRLGEEAMTRGRLLVLGEDHHVLLLTAHHLIFDGWSQSLLLRELSAVYAALHGGQDVSLPELRWQYSDYTRWQWDWMAGEEPAAYAEYWTGALAGVPAVLSLPTDRPRPPEQDFRGGRVAVAVDEDLTRALRALAEHHGVSLYTTVLTGWAVLLSLLSGQEDIVIGTPTANRRQGDVGGLIGFFANTLAVRADLSGSPTVGEALKRVNRRLRDGLAHVDLPFERVVELVNPPRSPACTALFQTMVAWVPSMRQELELPGVTVEVREDDAHVAAKFDLVAVLADEGRRLVGGIEYAAALFDRTTVERFARQLLRVFRLMTERPGADIGDLTLLDEDEQRELLSAFSWGGDPVTPAPAALLERFAEQVRTRPGQPAVVAGDAEVDYAALDLRANRVANALIARGVRPGQVVGLHAGRTLELVVGVLGILKAGAAYLPLDPGQPAERLAAMVADAEPALVLTDHGAPAAGGGLWQDLATVEAEGTREDAPQIDPDPARLAYVIYTSGSTGRPKGVAVTHGSVVNLLDHWRELMGDAAGEAASAWSSIGFDASVHELLVPLTTGAVLHLVPDELRGDPGALMGWLRERRVTQAFLPPSYIMWIDEDPSRRLAGLSLRQLLTGVESLPEAALHRMREELPGLRVCYGYGPTEATLYTTAYTNPQARSRSCPIGRPLRGTRLYLLDDRMRPVPVGVPGEVYAGGASLARGYLHRPDLTDERFVPDPFVPGERLYRTGDLARWLPDGNAQYVGRRDDQLKLRGFRIEPGEVEAALLAVPGVREAVVLADRRTPGDPHLVAGVGRDPGPARTPHEWRLALGDRLPDYMIPAVVAEFPRLPLNRNGKVDREAVLSAAAGTRAGRVNTAAPRDHVEMALYRIWRRVLLHPDVGVADNFFELGGTSISAIKMAHAVQEELGVALPVRDVMLRPTIEALAELVRGALSGTSGPAGHSSLVEFRAGDGRQRVVCVHPAGGTAFCYLPLSTALAEDVGVLGLQAPGINPGEPTLPTVEAMAQEYLRLVDPRPDEALVLCGLSYGGLIAHEMGRQLAAAGHERVSVVLLDTRGAQDAERHAAVTPTDMEEFREKLVRFNGMYPGIDDAQVARYLAVYNHHQATGLDYVVPDSRARVVLMQAMAVEDDEDGEAAARLRAFWKRRAGGGFAVEPVACGHWDMLESDELPRVAAVLTAELNRFGPDAGGGTGPAEARPSILPGTREQ